jgi:hypothetical protein
MKLGETSPESGGSNRRLGLALALFLVLYIAAAMVFIIVR